MSLILLSNDNKFNETGGIAQSNSWTNVAQTPIEIKANSQVALQSFKVNKEGQAQVTSGNNKFGWYMGNYIDEDATDDYQNQIRNVNDVILLPEKTYDPQELVSVLKTKLKKSIFHPDFQDGFNASVQYVSGDFQGYNLRMGYTTSTPSSSVPTAMVSAEPGLGDFTYNDSTGLLTAPSTSDCRAIGTTAPLSANAGSFIATFNTSGLDWRIGLSRYATETHPQPPYANVEEDIGWFDFVALRNDDGLLQLFHAVYDDSFDERGEISLNEVVYYGYTGAEYDEPYNLGTNPDSFGQIEFKLTGDKMELYIAEVGGDERTLVCSPDLGTPGKNNYFKPVNQACAYLFPKISLSQTLTSTISTFNGRAPTNFDYTGGADTNPLSMDFYRTCLQNGKISLCSELDTRFYNDIDDDTEYTFKGTNASGAIDFNCVLVVGNSFVYKAPQRPVNGYNVQELLGFEDETFVKATSFDNTFEKFTSTDIPQYVSTDSMFVRLTSGTQRSLNAYTGNQSKIIYHCPRFDNAGSEQGALYFEPGEKTYLDLGNPSDTLVNNFSVDIVDRNDKLIDGLIGSTIVMLHIKQK